jgi:LPXTG-motif cell wall-anchored protein
MIAVKITAFVVIMLCVLGLAYGGSTYTRGTQQPTQLAGLGFIDLWVKDTPAADIPVLAGVHVITIGGVLLFLRKKKN